MKMTGGSGIIGKEELKNDDKFRKKFKKFLTKLLASETGQNEEELEKFMEE